MKTLDPIYTEINWAYGMKPMLSFSAFVGTFGEYGQHDGKDAAMVAELVAHGKGTVWPFATLSEHRKMKGLIAMRKLCKSLWHPRVHNKLFDYSLVISGMPPRGRRRRRKAPKKAA